MAMGCTAKEIMCVRLWIRIVQSWKVCRSDYGYVLYSQGNYVGHIMAKDCTAKESMWVTFLLRIVHSWKVCRSDFG